MHARRGLMSIATMPYSQNTSIYIHNIMHKVPAHLTAGTRYTCNFCGYKSLGVPLHVQYSPWVTLRVGASDTQVASRPLASFKQALVRVRLCDHTMHSRVLDKECLVPPNKIAKEQNHACYRTFATSIFSYLMDKLVAGCLSTKWRQLCSSLYHMVQRPHLPTIAIVLVSSTLCAHELPAHYSWELCSYL